MDKMYRTNEEVFDFYKDKDPSPSVTMHYLKKGWGNKKQEYIDYALCCKLKGEQSDNKNLKDDHICNYRKIKKALEGGETFNIFDTVTPMEPLINIEEIDYNNGKPSQKWHLYGSYFAQSIVENYKKNIWDKNFKRSIRCKPLVLWMAEVSGVDVHAIDEAIQEDNEEKANSEINKISWDDIFLHIPQKQL